MADPGVSPSQRSQRAVRRERRQKLEDACHLVLDAAGCPIHYKTIASIVGAQSPHTPSGREVLYALRVLKGQQLVRCVRVGVYECATPSKPTSEEHASETPAEERQQGGSCKDS